MAGETGQMLTSSLTRGFAMTIATGRRREGTLTWLGATFALGAALIGVEVSQLFDRAGGGPGPARSGALSAFSTIVGTHGAHVTAGLS